MPQNSRSGAAVPLQVAGSVVREVLSVLSSELRLIYPDLPARALVRYLDEMQVALAQPNSKAIDDLLNAMRRAGIRDADIADFYIPVVARRLGENWSSDEMSFTQVTVGTANLQKMLRKLDSSWCMPERAPFGTLGEICIIVPDGVQHSLGASILAGQMRRAGYDVHLGCNLPLDGIAQFVSSPATVGIMLSASGWEPLDFLKTVVKKIRAGNPWAPVLVGGNVLEREEDVSALIGADHAMNDWQAALSFCARRVQP